MPEYSPPTPEGFFNQYFIQENVPPPEFRTIRQVAQTYGISESSAKFRLERLLVGGEVEKRKYRILVENGRHQDVWHYGPAPRKEPGH